jgi:hypothetical protein
MRNEESSDHKREGKFEDAREFRRAVAHGARSGSARREGKK